MRLSDSRRQTGEDGEQRGRWGGLNCARIFDVSHLPVPPYECCWCMRLRGLYQHFERRSHGVLPVRYIDNLEGVVARLGGIVDCAIHTFACCKHGVLVRRSAASVVVEGYGRKMITGYRRRKTKNQTATGQKFSLSPPNPLRVCTTVLAGVGLIQARSCREDHSHRVLQEN